MLCNCESDLGIGSEGIGSKITACWAVYSRFLKSEALRTPEEIVTYGLRIPDGCQGAGMSHDGR